MTFVIITLWLIGAFSVAWFSRKARVSFIWGCVVGLLPAMYFSLKSGLLDGGGVPQVLGSGIWAVLLFFILRFVRSGNFLNREKKPAVPHER